MAFFILDRFTAIKEKYCFLGDGFKKSVPISKKIGRHVFSK